MKHFVVNGVYSIASFLNLTPNVTDHRFWRTYAYWQLFFCLLLISRSKSSQPENQYEPIDPAEAAMLLGKTNSTNSRPENEKAEYAMVKKNDHKEVCIEYPINVLFQMIMKNYCSCGP